ncbi:uncharacterized protein [Coffea arabica]|uniref:Uncharacterized protein isoform X1 n=1 Tax=Coffea arabica TaxID=13443 RepID=A0A6P6TK75_COFAR|nr:uncharacterized protein LOC113702110 isoform X1 [Coffea arabica]
MENMLGTALNQMESNTLDATSPPPHNLQKPIKSPVSQNTAAAPCKSVTPSRLKVPKAFKYPERYTSPTDLMMSPVSRGLLARSRKPGALLPPSKNQPHQLQGLQRQEVRLFGI